jgi:hypothetical protein
MVKADTIIGKRIDQFTVESFMAEGANGVLSGTWGSGKGKETLRPVN